MGKLSAVFEAFRSILYSKVVTAMPIIRNFTNLDAYFEGITTRCLAKGNYTGRSFEHVGIIYSGSEAPDYLASAYSVKNQSIVIVLIFYPWVKKVDHLALVDLFMGLLALGFIQISDGHHCSVSGSTFDISETENSSAGLSEQIRIMEETKPCLPDCHAATSCKNRLLLRAYV
ncbi:hypothetical protein ACP4OV_027874 [Aristida adscensionis]